MAPGKDKGLGHKMHRSKCIAGKWAEKQLVVYELIRVSTNFASRILLRRFELSMLGSRGYALGLKFQYKRLAAEAEIQTFTKYFDFILSSHSASKN